MSPDDAKKNAGKKPQGRKPAGTSAAGKAPPARPSGVQKDQLPRAEAETPDPAASGAASFQLPKHLWSWVLIGAGVLLLLIFAAANLGGGGSGSGSVSAPATVPAVPETSPATPAEPTTTPEAEKPPAPPPKPSPPEKVWEHEITVEMNTSFNVDHFPIKNLPTGFVITDVGGPGEGLETVGGGKQAVWHGGSAPTYKNCVNTLGSTTGTEHIPLESSGLWICAETATHRIARFRFDSVSGYSYSFLVTVWHP
jgi:hypothetical protein